MVSSRHLVQVIHAVGVAKPQIMGILTVTRDAFFPDTLNYSPTEATDKPLAFEQRGADSIDVGGYSTGPGNSSTSRQEEAVPAADGSSEATGALTAVMEARAG
ncbi:MAG: dihydropteroate synthase [Alkalispirochaetaceae bacterium]